MLTCSIIFCSSLFVGFILSSWSIRTICCCPDITLVFVIVFLSQIMGSILMFLLEKSLRRSLKSLSSPVKPIIETSEFSPAIFTATFPAPPGLLLCFFTFMTGTGASGLILFTSPRMYLSTIISPTTR